MPKKYAGENSKAQAVKARRIAAKEAEEIKKQKELEDAHWKDNDKHVLRKQQRKIDQENKKQAILDKKAESRALLQKEVEAIVREANTRSVPPPKMSRAQIEEMSTKTVMKKKCNSNEDLEKNLNRLAIEGEDARNVTEAIKLLTDKTEMEDKHPEKRRRAAYLAYEKRRIAELKSQNPTLRLSQMKQMIFKDWQKSPENPLKKMLDSEV
ncbi:hypothetical protein Trydic_g17428 [Trypoxylus dichotomus]